MIILINQIAHKLAAKCTDERISRDREKPLLNKGIKLAVQRYEFARKVIKSRYGGSRIKILDVACGEGTETRILADSETTVFGVDLKDEFRPTNSNIVFRQMDSTKLEFPDNYFDCVVSMETIEHIKDYNRFLGEIDRVVKPEGLVIISTPNKKFFQKMLGKYYPGYNPYHVREFTTSEMKNALAKHYSKIDVYLQLATHKKPQLISILHGISHLFFTSKIVRRNKGYAGLSNIFVCTK